MARIEDARMRVTQENLQALNRRLKGLLTMKVYVFEGYDKTRAEWVKGYYPLETALILYSDMCLKKGIENQPSIKQGAHLIEAVLDQLRDVQHDVEKVGLNLMLVEAHRGLSAEFEEEEPQALPGPARSRPDPAEYPLPAEFPEAPPVEVVQDAPDEPEGDDDDEAGMSDEYTEEDDK